VTVSPLDDDSTLNWDQTTFGTGVSGAVDGYVGLTCDDETRVHTYGGTHVETLAVSSNNYATTTAGSLATITSTAYDQYGDGIAGVASRFMRRSVSSIGGNTDNNNVAILTSGANGTASLSAVVCATGGEVKNEWSIHDPTGNYMDAIAATAPNALAVEGTMMYCTTAGTDANTPLQQVADARATVVFTFNHAILGIDSAANTHMSITYAGGTAVTVPGTGTAGGFTHTTMQTKIRTLVGVDATTTCAATSGTVVTCTHPAGTGPAGTYAASFTNLADGAAATSVTITQGGASTSILGVEPITFTFIDDDLSTNTIVTEHTIKTDDAAGASVTTTKYQSWVYNSTDQFNVNSADDDIATSVTAATEAQFEAANAGLNDLDTDMTLTYRTGALTTGVSVWTIGT